MPSIHSSNSSSSQASQQASGAAQANQPAAGKKKKKHFKAVGNVFKALGSKQVAKALGFQKKQAPASTTPASTTPASTTPPATSPDVGQRNLPKEIVFDPRDTRQGQVGEPRVRGQQAPVQQPLASLNLEQLQEKKQSLTKKIPKAKDEFRRVISNATSNKYEAGEIGPKINKARDRLKNLQKDLKKVDRLIQQKTEQAEVQPVGSHPSAVQSPRPHRAQEPGSSDQRSSSSEASVSQPPTEPVAPRRAPRNLTDDGQDSKPAVPARKVSFTQTTFRERRAEQEAKTQRDSDYGPDLRHSLGSASEPSSLISRGRKSDLASISETQQASFEPPIQSGEESSSIRAAARLNTPSRPGALDRGLSLFGRQQSTKGKLESVSDEHLEKAANLLSTYGIHKDTINESEMKFFVENVLLADEEWLLALSDVYPRVKDDQGALTSTAIEYTLKAVKEALHKNDEE